MLYVDDMLIGSKDKSLINKLKSQLSDEYEMKDLGAAKKILGMEIHGNQKADKLYLSQRKYLEKVINRFNMDNCKSVSNPLAEHFNLSAKSCPKSEEEMERMSHIPNSGVVGSLMYAMVCAKPDLAYAVSMVSHYMHNPSKDHRDAVKWIHRYVKGSLDKWMVFDTSKNATYDVAGFVLSLIHI